MPANRAAQNVGYFENNPAFLNEINDGYYESKPIDSPITNLQKIQLAKEKDDFISLISHELITPVTGLKAIGQFLEHKFLNRGDEISASYLGKMNLQINKLTALIDELIYISNIEMGKSELLKEVFDFDDLVSGIIEEIQYTTKTHKITMYGYTDSYIFGDSARIAQTIKKLLHNAIKYSPAADEVVVTLGRVTDDLRLCVRDYGIGIEPKYQAHIFDKFYKIDNPRYETCGGLGLGLYISSKVIKEHGGKIWVESEANRGSQFWIELPVYDI